MRSCKTIVIETMKERIMPETATSYSNYMKSFKEWLIRDEEGIEYRNVCLDKDEKWILPLPVSLILLLL